MALDIAITLIMAIFITYVIWREHRYESRQGSAAADIVTLKEAPLALDPVKLLRSVKRRRRLGQFITLIIASSFFIVGLVVGAACLSAKVYIDMRGESVRKREEEAEQIRRGEQRQIGLGEAIGKGIGWAVEDLLNDLLRLIIYAIIFITVLSYLFLPALVSLPLSIFLLFTWRKPYNIIMLRPFLHKGASKSLKYFTRAGLCGFGFIYTLADTQIKQKWYVRYPIFLGQMSFLQFRIGKIKKRKSVDKLSRAMRVPAKRIFNWTVSRSKIFPATCTDEHWQYCMQSILPLADIVIIDLTAGKHGVCWEIQECERLGLMERIIFIVNYADVDRVPELLTPYRADTVRVITYGRSRKEELQRIMDEVSSRLSILKMDEPEPKFACYDLPPLVGVVTPLLTFVAVETATGNYFVGGVIIDAIQHLIILLIATVIGLIPFVVLSLLLYTVRNRPPRVSYLICFVGLFGVAGLTVLGNVDVWYSVCAGGSFTPLLVFIFFIFVMVCGCMTAAAAYSIGLAASLIPWFRQERDTRAD